MPNWIQILELVAATADEDGIPDFDRVRRLFLELLSQHTGRETILYASAWIQKPEHGDQSTITDEDLHALMAVSSGLNGPNLDLILHSPGGSVFSAEAFAIYLRERFQHIRVIVPNIAMSAATMIACSADEVVMGKHSFLGPTDPQIPVNTPNGWHVVAALHVLDQANRVRITPYDPVENTSWQAMLEQYGPDIVRRSDQAVAFAEEFNRTWLVRYLLRGNPDVANKIAKWLSNNEYWRDHGRHIARATLINEGMPIVPLEVDPLLQDMALSVFHATTQTFAGTEAVKIVENHLGRAYMKFEDRSPATASA